MIPTFRPFSVAVFAALALGLAAACSDGSGPQEPTPAITRLSPDTLLQWTENGLDLTVTGSGFRQGAVVRLNGEAQQTTFVSMSQLVAQVPEVHTHQSGTLQVSVLNPGTEGKESGTISLPVEHRRPTIHSMAPLQTMQGGGPLLLTVYGMNFSQGAVVRWNGIDRPTRFDTRWTLTAQIPASDLEQAGTVQVTVFNPAPGGGETPPARFDVIVRPNPVAMVTGVSPRAVIVGTDTEITLTGVGFMPESQVVVGGTSPATTVLSPTQLRFVLSGSIVNRTGSAAFNVVNPPPGGGLSNNVFVDVENPVPVLTALSPAQAVVSEQDLPVRIIGTGFTQESLVSVDGSYVDVAGRAGGTELQIVLPGWTVDEVGTRTIEVVNPGPGGGVSNVLTLALVSQTPVVQSISPSETEASPFITTFPVQLTGSGFGSETMVRVNGESRPTDYVGPTTLVVTLFKEDVDEPGTLTLVAVNPPPAGSSNPVTFTVTEPSPLPPPGGP